MKRTVEIEIDLSEISNYTLSKLTRDEICCLGLQNVGIYTYKGSIKKIVKGFKITPIDNNVFYYENYNDNVCWVIIRIIPSAYESEYAVRLYNKETREYEPFYPVLNGCEFFK